MSLISWTSIFQEESDFKIAFSHCIRTSLHALDLLKVKDKNVQGYLPLGSTSFKAFLTSACVGLCPRARSTSPSCDESIFPSPLRSKSVNDSLCSRESKKL